MIRRFLADVFLLVIILLPGSERSVAATTPPSSAITSPSGGSTLHGQTITITGNALDYSNSGLRKVEISINGSAWTVATRTTSWNFVWTLPADGVYTIRTRATDNMNNVETPGAGINVVVDNCGTSELQHYNWDQSVNSQGCSLCHAEVSRFLTSDFNNMGWVCITCHSHSGIGHERLATGRQHPVMVNVSTSWTKKPTYGSITAPVNDNRPFAHLKDGRLIICATCHNVMNKYEDCGRAWELTSTTDDKTYSMEKGGWSFMGSLNPNVYRSASLWSGPTFSKERKGYLVDPSEYTYDETAGTVTFASPQPHTTYIYVTLDYPYLRVSSRNNAICLDCHMESTHEGAKCLACHQAHNTSNISGIRQVVRTPDNLELNVRFINRTGTGSFADGDSDHDGVCEICHTRTLYYRRDGSGSPTHANGKNYSRKDCTECHSHLFGFATSKPVTSSIVVNSLIPDNIGAIPGATVTWTATATGGTGNLLYRFLRNGPDSAGSFVLARNWDASNKWAWTTTSAMVGGNIVRVNVMNSNGTGTVASQDYLTYTVALNHQVLLTWGPSPSTNVAGYKVYFGTASGLYTKSIIAGKVTTYTVGNLSSGTKYYFALTSYDSYGNESIFSNEKNVTIP